MHPILKAPSILLGSVALLQMPLHAEETTPSLAGVAEQRIPNPASNQTFHVGGYFVGGFTDAEGENSSFDTKLSPSFFGNPVIKYLSKQRLNLKQKETKLNPSSNMHRHIIS